MRGEGAYKLGYRLRELALALLWAAMSIGGVALFADPARAARHAGDMLVRASGLAFLALAFLLIAERPARTPAVDDEALTRRRYRPVRRNAIPRSLVERALAVSRARTR